MIDVGQNNSLWEVWPIGFVVLGAVKQDMRGKSVNSTPPRSLNLFLPLSSIPGFPLWWTSKLQCEINPFLLKLLLVILFYHTIETQTKTPLWSYQVLSRITILGTYFLMSSKTQIQLGIKSNWEVVDYTSQQSCHYFTSRHILSCRSIACRDHCWVILSKLLSTPSILFSTFWHYESYSTDRKIVRSVLD